MLGKDQDPFGELSNVIYQVPCSCGHANIGKTKTAHKTRMKEHKVATRRVSWRNQTIADDARNDHHQVDWDKITVLDEMANNTTLLIKKPSTYASWTWIH